MNPTRPHPGKVSTHASAISFTTLQFTAEILFAAPTPMIDVVLVCVVETGMPVVEARKRQIAAAISDAKPWYTSSFVIFCPTSFIILYPPMDVPRPIMAEHMIISQMGI